ncbi:hypothetical protein MMC09_001548 [Bachmanniomyces sp. S44760]|nr:hypothetical protein [Bachmanniomyces sp. S44760]
MSEESHSELEYFRKRWREEVAARSKGATPASIQRPRTQRRQSNGFEEGKPKQTRPSSTTQDVISTDEDNHDAYDSYGYHDLPDKDKARRLGEEGESVHPSNKKPREPESALEHYEKAVEKEKQGSLGDSLTHYRKAYRLDDSVDQTYKNKYFPPSSFAPKQVPTISSSIAGTASSQNRQASDGSAASSVSHLITSISSASIMAIPTSADHSSAAPCPIASLPSELLVSIFRHAAVLDVSSFARSSLVCKRFAYLVATEDQIWRRICLGHEFGFTAMPYNFKCSILGAVPLKQGPLDDAIDNISSLILGDDNSEMPHPNDIFPLTPTYPTYLSMFRNRPRLRFNGCYISTVNYVRPGVSSPNQIAWNTPVLVVTYYRYLRFFRDGTCVSLLTTNEPVDVVHYLTKEHMHDRHTSGSALPSAVMKNALRGRWRLSGPDASPFRDSKVEQEYESEPEGFLYIETQGANSKHTYSMHLSIKSSSNRPGATKNNKLMWRGFWSYNCLTDDWAEFGLRNDKPFFWSRVRSYGMGD